MKSLNVLLPMLCMALSAMAASALPPASPAEDPEILVRTSVVRDHAFRLVLANLMQETTTISIENLDGTRTFFKDFVRNHNGYGRIIDLEKVPAGRYVLRISQSDETLNAIIYVNEETVRISQVK